MMRNPVGDKYPPPHNPGVREGMVCPQEGSRLVRWSLMVSGSICLMLGLVGIFVPVLPTTPFLLLAAACYARSSQRFYCWLVGNRLFGAYIRSYREGRGLPLRVRLFTIVMLWLTIGVTVIFLVEPLWLRALLLFIASAVTVHVVTIRPRAVSDGP